MFEIGAEVETEIPEVERDATGSEEVQISTTPFGAGCEKTLSSYFTSGSSSGDDPFASLSQASQNKSEEEEEEFLSLPPATTVTALPELEEAATSGKTAEEADSRNEETIITAEIGGKT